MDLHVVTYVIALVLAWLVAPGGRHECFWIVLVAIDRDVLYSVPPLRTKRLGIWANVTIAIPRGVLLKVAGWSAVKTVLGVEPWYIGGIFGLFLLGASTTKDFADMEGDARGRLPHAADHLRRDARGVDDLAVVRRAVPADRRRHRVRHPHRQLRCCCTRSVVVMTVYGLYVCYLMLQAARRISPSRRTTSRGRTCIA